jgi:PAS domain S-box-containing protein
MPHYDKMTQGELVAELRALRADPRLLSPLTDVERLLHELQVHQIELEMQNRELRESQHLLEESRAWYAELFELAPIGYCTLDTSGLVLEANLTACGLFRVDRSKLVGRSLASFVSPGYEQTWHEHLAACLAQRVRVTDEIALTVRGRGPVVMQVVSTISLWPDGSVAGVRTTISDISALKQSQSMLRFLAEASAAISSSLDYEQTLSAVVRLAVPVLADVCCVDVLDDHDQLRRVGTAFADGTKQALEQRITQSAPDRSGTTPQAQVLRSGRAILLPSPDQALDVSDGAERDVGAKSLMFVPLTARERTLGVLTFIMAQSERRYGAKELAVAEDIARRAAMAIDNAHLYRAAQAGVQSRDDFLAIASHDLRSPLSAIIMAVHTLLDPGLQHAEHSTVLRHIERATQRMHRMVGDLVDVSSMDAGRLSLYRTAHELPELLAETVQSFSEQAAQRGLSLEVEVSGSGLRAQCDRDRVLQILSNLVGNAIKFTPHGGSVRVRAELRSDMVRVAVIDTGRGIAASRLPRLFERYYQEQETAPLGRGLGLYIARRLVEAHGGTIWIENTPGGGTTFCFTLPLALSGEESALRRSEDLASGSEGSGEAAMS